MRLPSLMAVAALLSICVAARAATVTFVLNNPNQFTTAMEDDSFDLNATISAPATNTGDYFLNFTLNDLSQPFHGDDLLFESPAFLTPGESYTGTVLIIGTKGASAGVYNGSILLFGGASSIAEDATGPDTFTITVTPDVVSATTPEPSSFVLLGTGLLGRAGVVKRRFA